MTTLKLGRWEGQRIMINDNIIVAVDRVDDKGYVTLSITAPHRVVIHREEIWEKIQKELASKIARR